MDYNDPRVGTGSIIPKKFRPPKATDTPQSLFPAAKSFKATPTVQRFIRRTNAKQLLIYTDGSCINNGGANPRAGCSFVFKPHHHTRFPLETEGPTGELHHQTSNRAELRAVIAVLRFRAWAGEGFNSLVIATDSEYVVEGITSWVRGWLRKGWTTRIGAPVKNRDLWECLLGELEACDEDGLQVLFWRIPREWNTDADLQARYAADEGPQIEFCDVMGVMLV